MTRTLTAAIAVAAVLIGGIACQSTAPAESSAPAESERRASPRRTIAPSGYLRTPDGVALRYESRGSGSPALLFVHCWGCDRTFWTPQVTEFSDDYQVVTLDLSGHGGSSTGRLDWRVTSLASDVVEVANAFYLDDVILIGHSMGGPVALAAAARMPGRVRGVVLVDTVHDAEASMPEEQAEQIYNEFETDFEGAMSRFVTMLTGPNADPFLDAWISERAKDVDRAGALKLMRDFANVDNAALLRDAGVPVRAINAAPAPPMQPVTAVETNRKYADYDAVLIDGVGHYPQLEKPDEFNEELWKIIESLTAAEE